MPDVQPKRCSWVDVDHQRRLALAAVDQQHDAGGLGALGERARGGDRLTVAGERFQGRGVH